MEFFWRLDQSRNGDINNSCMCQWWHAPFSEERVTFSSCEQYMMFYKARVFKDEEAARKILKAKDPKAIKDLGRAVKNFNEAKWGEVKYAIVMRGNYLKFSQNAKLKQFLLGTGDKVLVEASPFDRVWGIGLAEEDLLVTYPRKWKGQNLLGFALMEVRDMLKD